MKKRLGILILIIFVNCTSTENNKDYLIGIVNKKSFSIVPYTTWFTKNYTDYTPDTSAIHALNKELKAVTIKGFMGTWCGDSKEQIPVFYKILDAANFEEHNIQMTALNHSKKTPDSLQKGYHIIRVPTFIFYKKGKEIGRFVEYPKETMELDFLKIVRGIEYRHSYEDN